MATYVFVYGSLKMGYENHYILETSTFISDATTCEKYQMYPSIDGEYPFLIKSEKVQNIIGEVYLVNDQAILDALDQLENYPEYYLKEFIDVAIEDGSIISVLTYFKNEQTHQDCMDTSNPMSEWF